MSEDIHLSSQRNYILQAYTGVSDDEVSETTLMDRRWQLVLDCLATDHVPFSKGTLVAFRKRLMWSYRRSKPGITHLGPMVQDFYRAFQVGASPRTMDLLDVTGILLQR